MRKLLLIAFVFGSLSAAIAQTRSVSGKVTQAEDGTVLPGVNVVLKGTTNGTVSDAEGHFSITVPATGGILVFSFVGERTREVTIGDRAVLDIQLEADVTQLSEAVVVGYGTQERRDLTGSVASVKGSEISNLATPSFDQQLAGRAAGVNVQIPSGIIGQAPVIRIRGVNSLTSSADPLIVIDNMPMTSGGSSGIIANNVLADINPADIESFEVLKDGSATAIYGSRAANGVILITTKKGKKGKTTVNYDAFVGFSNTFRKYDVLNADQFIQIQNEKFTNAGTTPQAVAMTQNGQPVNTDWQKQIFRTGGVQNHALSMDGATEKTAYHFSLGWMDQKGAAVANEQKRYTLRANFDHKATNWLSFGTNLGLTRTQTIGLNTGSTALSGNVFNALSEFPNVPVYNADGSYNIQGANTGQGNNLANNDFNLPNIAFVLSHNKNNATNYRVVGDAHAEAIILKDFKLRTQIGVDGLLNDDFLYNDARQGDGYPAGTVIQNFATQMRWNWQNLLTYSRIFGENHKVNVTVGEEFQKFTTSNYFASGQGLSNPFLGQNNIISGSLGTQTIGGDYTQTGFSSYFGRANYAFKDKYLLQASFRQDKISNFAKSNQTGTFPGGSVGWRLSNEEFFKSASGLNFISDLKLRASYAQVGNSNLQLAGVAAPFIAFPLYAPVQYGLQNGLGYSQAGNPNLKWETSKKFDYGLNVGLWDNRITVIADYYLNKVDGLILNSPVPPSVGIPGNSVAKNVGSMQNSGLEFTVAAQVLRMGDFAWNTDINYSTNHNKVTQLDKSGDILSAYQVTRVGESIGSYWGYIYDGVNKANGNPIYTKADGSFVQGNIADNSYYVYDPANPGTLGASSSLDPTKDKRILGKSTPTYFGGWNNNFTYKSFDFTVFSRFSGGNKVFNLTRQNLLTQQFANNSTEILGRWQSVDNPGNGQVPMLQYSNGDFINLANNATTRFLEKGDFFRIQNITLGYTLPRASLDKIKLNKLRIFAQVQNVLLITKYKGIDPEASATPGSNTTAGIDSNTNPQLRTFTLGVNVGL
jgi:TonB-linked SusC/RagA family outer membrane protein